MKLSLFLFAFLFMVSAIVTAAGFYYMYLGQNEYLGAMLGNTGGNFMQIVGIIFLIQNATIYKTRYWRILQGAFSMALVAVCFKILHWRGAYTLILISYLGLVITYSARFASKKPISLNDVFKWLWVVCLMTGTCLILLHWKYGAELKMISLGLLVLVVLHTVFLQLFKKGRDNAQGLEDRPGNGGG